MVRKVCHGFDQHFRKLPSMRVATFFVCGRACVPTGRRAFVWLVGVRVRDACATFEPRWCEDSRNVSYGCLHGTIIEKT